MKKLFFISTIWLAFILFQACNNQQENKETTNNLDSLNAQNIINSSENESKFLTEVASGVLMEVELGNMADSIAHNIRVKNFGMMMVNDHYSVNNELKKLAIIKNIQITNVPIKAHQDKIDDLKGKSEKDFDKAYINMMVKNHEENIDKFEDAANDSKDADIKAFANNILPKLRVHLDSAKAIKDAIKD